MHSSIGGSFGHFQFFTFGKSAVMIIFAQYLCCNDASLYISAKNGIMVLQFIGHFNFITYYKIAQRVVYKFTFPAAP